MDNFNLSFSDKNITPWGGISLMKRMLDRMGFTSALQDCKLPTPASNRGYSPVQLIEQFMISIWCGANRYEHAEITRMDDVLRNIFGFTRMAGHRTISRLFGKFDQNLCGKVFDNLYSWFFSSLNINYITLDLDSTVITRYGNNQEGATKGYNPNKRGRPSHNPLMAFIADTEMVANFWLRPGSSHSANNVAGFLDNTLEKLGNINCSLIRADSGFASDNFFVKLEKQNLNYVIALPMMQTLQRTLVSQTGWWPLESDEGSSGKGIELCCFEWQSNSWSKPRRVIAVRQNVKVREEIEKRALGKQLSLFTKDDEQYGKYRYGAMTTDLRLSALEIWRLYRGRANCENRIKELKYDFGAGSFNQKNFFATEATLSTVMMAFNLMSLFRKTLIKGTTNQTLKTLRYKLFAIPGYITNSGRKRTLNLALALKRREWVNGLWERSSSFTKPVYYSSIFEPCFNGVG